MPKRRLDAVAVSSTDLEKTAAFYRLLGFEFPDITPETKHLEPHTAPGDCRLMIDTVELMTQLIGTAPVPPNHSSFAMLCDTPGDVDAVAASVKAAGYDLRAEPWDAFWGQRYAIVADPDGYQIDLFAELPEQIPSEG